MLICKFCLKRESRKSATKISKKGTFNYKAYFFFKFTIIYS